MGRSGSVLGRLYLEGRRVVRRLVIGNDAVDRSLGVLLRRFERRFIGLSAVRRTVGDEGGVVRVDGLELGYRAEDLGVVAPLIMHGAYEPETRDVVQAVLSPGSTFVDLGAHIGYFSLLAARQVGRHGRVYAFEPVAETANVLEENVKRNDLMPPVQVVRRGIYERPAELTFALAEGSSVSNKMAAVAPSGDGTRTPAPTRTIAVTSLDAFFADETHRTVDLIKMDVEGAELPAMRGMAEVSRANPNLKLIFEFHDQNLRQLGLDPMQLFDQLNDLGFRRYVCLHRRPRPFRVPDDLAWLVALSQKTNVNILAEK
ncbi:MAG: FkbM family methyltransferase [Myxococcota bacterium]